MENELEKIIEHKKHVDRRLRIINIIVVSLIIGIVFLVYDSLQKKQEANHELVKDKTILKNEVKELQKQIDSINAASVKISLGASYATSKRPKQAIEAYSQAIKLDPSNAVAYRLRGYIYLVTGEKQKAVSDLKKSVNLDSTEAWTHYNLALAYMAVKDTTNALSETKKVITLDSDFRETIENDVQFRNIRKLPEYEKMLDVD
jgi:tetratricopeptide (TPR) repeat protein